jgi:hypothetical protein
MHAYVVKRNKSNLIFGCFRKICNVPTYREAYFLIFWLKIVIFCDQIFDKAVRNVEDDKDQLFWKKYPPR